MNMVPQPEAAFAGTQNWNAYTEEQHAVWNLLFTRRMSALRSTASGVFLDGVRSIGLASAEVPELERVNARLQSATGWRSVPVTGFLPAPEFFACLAQRRFPTTTVIRSREMVDYVEAPDIFHDVFGHVPLHSDPVFSDFLQEFGEMASAAVHPDDVERMARLFWFSVEFGLIHENGATRMYGSGLISSSADAINALGPDCDRRPFSLDAVFAQPFEIDRLQDVLFVVESFDELFEAVRSI